MKKLVALLLCFSLSAAAADVIKFDPRPAAVEQESNTYIGVLLSEEDFRKILENKIDTNARLGECSIDERVCAKQKEIFEKEAKKLEEVILKNNSWLERNRGTLGLLTGLALGAGLSVGIVHAVYPR
jgi:invasion protein IalB